MAETTTNGAWPKLLALVCTGCGKEYQPADNGAFVGVDARELGDGAICVTCPDCDRDMAVFRV